MPPITILGGVVDFGSESYNRAKLREVLQLATGDGKHAHHIIPWEFKGNALIQKAARSDNMFHSSEKLNGIPLPSSNHLTEHQAYNTKVQQKLTELYNPSNTPQKAFDDLAELIGDLRILIENNPNLNLGQIANLIP